MSEPFNVSTLVSAQARRAPRQVALVEAAGPRRATYAELERRIDLCAHAFVRAGLLRGDRTCVFVTPGIEWAAIVFGLMRMGALPALIDPAMGRAGLLGCVERLAPRGFVGVPLAAALRLAFARSFASVEVALTTGRVPLGGRTLRSCVRANDGAFEPAPTAADDKAAILFTSGSTGPAKGVPYTHGMLRAQVAALRGLYAMREGEVELACFAPFALFGPALGLTTVLAPIDFSHPARAEPAAVVRTILEHRPVQSFGSPAIWRRVAPWARERGIVLDSLRRVMIAGAPVGVRLIEECLAVLPPEGDVHTPYGATEALPVASASGREILARHREATESGAGNCVGALAPFVEARVIRVGDEPLAQWSDALLVRPGEPGELVVRGPQVTREYEGEPAHTAASKIGDPAGVWHRMGDIVRLDADANLWFLGRKSQRLQTASGALFPVGVENVFLRHAAVQRAALVGLGPRGLEQPVLVVELRAGAARAGEPLAREILALGARHAEAARVTRVLFHSSFPVDVRHNAKIDRGALKLWAQEQRA